MLRIDLPSVLTAARSLIRIAGLCLIAANTAHADDIVRQSDLDEIATAAQAGQCDNGCEITNWSVQPGVFPPDLDAVAATGARLYLLYGKPPQNCGASRCMSATLVEKDGQWQVVKDGSGEEGFAVTAADINLAAAVPPLDAIAHQAGLQITDLPHLALLQPADLSALQTAAAAIPDDASKQTLLSALLHAANIAAAPILQRLVLDRFAIDPKLILAGVVANAPTRPGKDISGTVTDLAATMVADAILSTDPLATLPAPWKAPLQTLTTAILTELLTLGPKDDTPSPEVQSIAARLHDVHQIYRASTGLATAQDALLAQTALSLEAAARTASLHPSDASSAMARDTVNTALSNLRQVFAPNDSPALADIVNLTFVGLMADLRGDDTRANMIVERMRTTGKLTAPPPFADIAGHPMQWLADVATWPDDPAARTATMMISVTTLGSMSKTETAPTADTWTPAIVSATPMAPQSCDSAKQQPACLKALGFSDQAIAFSHQIDGDFSGLTTATAFRETGAVDVATALIVGASEWTYPVLLNGGVGFAPVARTTDVKMGFADPGSQTLLTQYPNAASWDIAVKAARTLPDGAQRFVVSELITEGCHACMAVGTAITFLDVPRDSKGPPSRQPLGIGYDARLPGMDMEITPDLLRQSGAILQFELNLLGYDAGSMDGVPGPQTRQALMEFQVEHCLVPNGQMDDKTATTLIAADGFAAPCAGARLPDGITANTPLLRGAYVDLPTTCDSTALPVDAPHKAVLIDGPDHHFDSFDQTCRILRTDLADRLTKFSAECSVEGSDWAKSTWFADLQANDSFDILWDQTARPQSFYRCADDTALATLAFGPPEPASAKTAPQNLGLIGNTADLFNLLPAQLSQPCFAPCTEDGAAGTYSIAPLTTVPTDAIVAVNDIYFEQGVSRVQPQAYPALDQPNAYRFWSVSRTDCDGASCPAAVIAILVTAIDQFNGEMGYSGPGGRFLDLKPGFQFTAQQPAPPPPPPPQVGPFSQGSILNHNLLTHEDLHILSALLPPAGYGVEGYDCDQDIRIQKRAEDLSFAEQVDLQKRLDQCIAQRAAKASAFSKNLGQNGRFVVELKNLPLEIFDTNLYDLNSGGKGVEIFACGVPRWLGGGNGYADSLTGIDFELPEYSRLSESREFKGPAGIKVSFGRRGEDCPTSGYETSNWAPTTGLSLSVRDFIRLRISDIDLGARLDADFRRRGIRADLSCIALYKAPVGGNPVCILSNAVIKYGDGEVMGVQQIAVAQ